MTVKCKDCAGFDKCPAQSWGIKITKDTEVPFCIGYRERVPCDVKGEVVIPEDVRQEMLADYRKNKLKLAN
ncbi:MAG: hypothetical protein H0Z35_12505 [Thermoanaerobacteraceae bacterium]|nr:hypothetical protein [Thermoanaerobacteraceae bacterium]